LEVLFLFNDRRISYSWFSLRPSAFVLILPVYFVGLSFFRALSVFLRCYLFVFSRFFYFVALCLPLSDFSLPNCICASRIFFGLIFALRRSHGDYKNKNSLVISNERNLFISGFLKDQDFKKLLQIKLVFAKARKNANKYLKKNALTDL